MIFERLYGMFSGVDTMIIRVDKLDSSLVLVHELLDGCNCLVVGDVEDRGVTFLG